MDDLIPSCIFHRLGHAEGDGQIGCDGGKVKRVCPARILDRVDSPAIAEEVSVIPGAARQGIVSRTTGDAVGGVSAEDRVIPGPANDVLERATQGQVQMDIDILRKGTGEINGNPERAPGEIKGIIACAGASQLIDDIVTEVALGIEDIGVIPSIANHDVIASAADQDVIAVIAIEPVDRREAADHILDAADPAGGAGGDAADEMDFHRCGVGAVIEGVDAGLAVDAVEDPRKLGAIGEDEDVALAAADQVLDIGEAEYIRAGIGQAIGVDIPGGVRIHAGDRVGPIFVRIAHLTGDEVDVIEPASDAGLGALETVDAAQAGQDPVAWISVGGVIERIHPAAAIHQCVMDQCRSIIEEEDIIAGQPDQRRRLRVVDAENIIRDAADDDFNEVPNMGGDIPISTNNQRVSDLRIQAEGHSAEVKRIRAVAQILKDRVAVPAVSEDVGVISGATGDRIRPRTALQDIIVAVADNGVVSATANHILDVGDRSTDACSRAEAQIDVDG